MPPIKVSIIVPAYNEEHYLEGCLKSLIAQSNKPHEIIVVNNNSTDATEDIARKYTDKVFLCREQGISAARNFGASKATGNLLCFIDADAHVSRDWVRMVKKRFLKNNRLAAVSGFSYFGTKNPLKFPYYNLYNLIVFTALFIGNKIGKYFVAGNNMAIRKSLFFKAGGFPKLIGEDVRLSKALRKYKPLTIGFEPVMTINYSPRRFEKKGFFRTLGLWIKSTKAELSEKTYKENYGA